MRQVQEQGSQSGAAQHRPPHTLEDLQADAELRGDVDRITPARHGLDAADLRQNRLGQRRHRQARADRSIRQQDADAAGHAEDTDFRPPGLHADRADIGDVDHLLDGFRTVVAAAAAPTSVRPTFMTITGLPMAAARRTRLAERSAAPTAALNAAGLPRLPSTSHIVPIPVPGAERCRAVARRLLEDFGLYVTPINYPTVPRGAERLRLCATPFHDDAMIADLVQALRKVLA
jgi:hypothetical protein